MKIALWTILGSVVCIGLVIGIGIYMFQKDLKKTNPEYIVQFIKENAEKENVSVSINYNDEDWIKMKPHPSLEVYFTAPFPKEFYRIEFD